MEPGAPLMASLASPEPLGDENVCSPDPKPVRRLRASQSDWDIIRKGFAGARCLACGEAAESLHHVVPRSQGGDDVAANMAPLCGDGTRGCHGILEAHAPGWERVANAVRVYVILDKDRCLYVVGKLGWERFANRYPLLSEPGPEYARLERGPVPTPGSESDWERDFLHYEEPVWRFRPPEEDTFEIDSVEGYPA